MVSATIGAQAVSLRYDPMGRLYEVTGATTTRFLYDGDELVAEYATAGAMLKRYVHGIAVDDPVIQYDGSGIASTALRHLIADRQGSVIGIADSSGAIIARNTYDEYGIPKSDQAGQAVVGRFAYTGQIWLPELGMYHYKARLYSPTLGRFLQTDPIGYDDQINLYAYVGNDPVNASDPDGTETWLAHANLTCINPNACPIGGGLGGVWFNKPESGNEKPSTENENLRKGHNNPPNSLLSIIKGAGWVGIVKAILSMGGDNCKKCSPPQSSFDENRVDHIFRKAEGHYAKDTSSNRQALIETWSNGKLVKEAYGNKYFARQNKDGTENWVIVRDGKIANGGINLKPRW